MFQTTNQTISIYCHIPKNNPESLSLGYTVLSCIIQYHNFAVICSNLTLSANMAPQNQLVYHVACIRMYQNCHVACFIPFSDKTNHLLLVGGLNPSEKI